MARKAAVGRAEKNEAALLNCAELPELALTAGLSSCSNSFGYVRDNGLAGIVPHSPEDDPSTKSLPR